MYFNLHDFVRVLINRYPQDTLFRQISGTRILRSLKVVHFFNQLSGVCEISKQQHEMPMLVDAPNLVIGGVDGIDTFHPIDLLRVSLQIDCHFLQADT